MKELAGRAGFEPATNWKKLESARSLNFKSTPYGTCHRTKQAIICPGHCQPRVISAQFSPQLLSVIQSNEHSFTGGEPSEEAVAADNTGIDDGAAGNARAPILQILTDSPKRAFTRLMPFQQMTEVEERAHRPAPVSGPGQCPQSGTSSRTQTALSSAQDPTS